MKRLLALIPLCFLLCGCNAQEPVGTPTEEIYSDAGEERIFNVYAEPAEIEQMFRDYFDGRGEMNYGMLHNITELEIYGTEYISVTCGDLKGTEHGIVSAESEASDYQVTFEDGTTALHPRPERQTLSYAKYLTNVKRLTVCYQYISDVFPLSELTQLEYLNLKGNTLYDCTPLSGLVDLKELDISSSGVEQLPDMSGMKSLERLNVRFGNLDDEHITPLGEAQALKWLDLGYNDMDSDLSPIGELTQLEYLDLYAVHVSDISGLAGAQSLEYLDLHSSDVTDLTPLSGLTELKELDISYTDIEDISALVPLTKL